MNQIYINRLAILDNKEKTKFYEVSSSRGFRFFSEEGTTDHVSFQEISDVISEAYLGSLSNDNPIIVTVPIDDLGINKILSLPKDMVYIQIKLPTKITVNTIKKLKLLKEKGYNIVLDHFKRKSKLAFHIMPYCDIMKINRNEFEDEEFRTVVKFLKSKDKKVLAINVNTQEEREYLSKHGADLFSGNYLSKPKLIANKKLDSFKPNSLHLLKLITATPIDFGELHSLISKDIVFTYRLIKYVNSSFFIKEKNISDVKFAIAYLGEKEIKKWAFILLSSSLGEDKPDELMVKALTKARFCEIVASKLKDVTPEKAFMMGIFSYLEILTQIPFQDLADELELDPVIVDAINKFEGILGTIFELSSIYESCRWDKLTEFIERKNLTNLELSKYYFDTVTWVNQIMA